MRLRQKYQKEEGWLQGKRKGKAVDADTDEVSSINVLIQSNDSYNAAE